MMHNYYNLFLSRCERMDQTMNEILKGYIIAIKQIFLENIDKEFKNGNIAFAAKLDLEKLSLSVDQKELLLKSLGEDKFKIDYTGESHIIYWIYERSDEDEEIEENIGTKATCDMFATDFENYLLTLLSNLLIEEYKASENKSLSIDFNNKIPKFFEKKLLERLKKLGFLFEENKNNNQTKVLNIGTLIQNYVAKLNTEKK